MKATVRLSDSLACVACGLPGNACWTWMLRYNNEWGRKVEGENLGAPLEKVAGREVGLPHMVCSELFPKPIQFSVD